jgi:hypothetical protein
MAGLLALAIPETALADADGAEFWLNPSATFALDEDTSVELETAQRLRSAADGRSDTYFGRLWLNQGIAEGVALGGALERRINTEGAADETRLIQQMSLSRGVLRARLRLEQRFVEDADRTGLRVRPRVGVSLPLGANARWSAFSDAELYLTLLSTSRGGDHGLTGLRTQIGVAYDVSDRLSLSVGYLRQETFNDTRPDEVGHAPIVGIEFSF